MFKKIRLWFKNWWYEVQVRDAKQYHHDLFCALDLDYNGYLEVRRMEREKINKIKR